MAAVRPYRVPRQPRYRAARASSACARARAGTAASADRRCSPQRMPWLGRPPDRQRAAHPVRAALVPDPAPSAARIDRSRAWLLRAPAPVAIGLHVRRTRMRRGPKRRGMALRWCGEHRRARSRSAVAQVHSHSWAVRIANKAARQLSAAVRDVADELPKRPHYPPSGTARAFLDPGAPPAPRSRHQVSQAVRVRRQPGHCGPPPFLVTAFSRAIRLRMPGKRGSGPDGAQIIEDLPVLARNNPGCAWFAWFCSTSLCHSDLQNDDRGSLIERGGRQEPCKPLLHEDAQE